MPYVICIATITSKLRQFSRPANNLAEVYISCGFLSGLWSLRFISTLALPTFDSTGDPRSCSSTGFPCPIGSPLVSCHSTFATNLRAVHCIPSLHPYGCSGFLSPCVLVLHLRRSSLQHPLGNQCQGCCSVPFALRLHLWIHRFLFPAVVP